LGGESERHIEGMTKAAEAVLADALRLDVDARAERTARLEPWEEVKRRIEKDILSR
jgi:hypothetical protein